MIALGLNDHSIDEACRERNLDSREIRNRGDVDMKKAIALVAVLGFVAVSIQAALCQEPDPQRSYPRGVTDKKPRNADAPLQLPKIDNRPNLLTWPFELKREVPKHDPEASGSWKVDLRHAAISNLDLRGRLDDLLRADFDHATKWPAADRLPAEFKPAEIMGIGKNPGLGLRTLHKQGVTGKRVGIAMIDQVLLTDHIEYKDRLRLYEEMGPLMNYSTMHGPAVASIAVGKSLGVAPEADLYYIAACIQNFRDDRDIRDFQYYAKAVRRILKINEQLPERRKIRVISMQVGWDQKEYGYRNMQAAAVAAKEAGMLVVCSSIEQVHGLKFHGLGRNPLADPEDFNSFGPGLWWRNQFLSSGRNIFAGRLLVPMDSRTTAAPTSATGYVFYREGGWSWSIPYIAGLYALAVQEDPTITPDRFWQIAIGSGRSKWMRPGFLPTRFGPIVDPTRLIETIRKQKM